MRISDWSSGVCSSDLVRRSAHRDVQAHRVFERLEGRDIARQNALVVFFIMTAAHFDDDPPRAQEQLPAVGVRRERRAIARQRRSEERRVGNECVSTCRSRWWPTHEKKKKTKKK